MEIMFVMDNILELNTYVQFCQLFKTFKTQIKRVQRFI